MKNNNTLLLPLTKPRSYYQTKDPYLNGGLFDPEMLSHIFENLLEINRDKENYARE